MSEDKRFEDILRERLYEYELPPPMHLWPAVAARKKRRGGLGWLAVGAGALAVGLLVWVWGVAFRQMTPGDLPAGQLPVLVPEEPLPVREATPPPVASLPEETPGARLAEAPEARGRASFRADRPQGVAVLAPAPPSEAPSARPSVQAGPPSRARVPLSLPPTAGPWLLPQKKLRHNDCPDKFGKRLRLGLFAEAWAGPWLGFGTLSPRADDAQLEAYARARRQTERRRLGYGAGLHLVLRTHRGLALRTGLDWTEMRERFFFKQENVERVIVVTRYDDQGNVVGIDTTIETGTLVRQTTNRLQMASVPLSVGWHRTRRHWSWSVYAGLVWNLSLRASGDLLSPELEPVSLREGDAQTLEVFRTRVGMGSTLSASVQWMPAHGLTVFAEPVVRRWSRSFTRDSYPLEQRYTEAGLRLGVRWRW